MGDEVAWLREEEKDRTEEDHFFAVAKGAGKEKDGTEMQERGGKEQKPKQVRSCGHTSYLSQAPQAVPV